MPESEVYSPTRNPTQFKTADGRLVDVPMGWACLPPGDAGLTRRLKSLGPTWTVAEKVGRKTFSKGVWAPAENIERAQSEVSEERASPAYAKKKASSARRRDEAQTQYVEDFAHAVKDFLHFNSHFEALADQVAQKVAAHATPVGSGTVARTKRISLEQRAEAAVIAWLRHHTTAYDDMKVSRVRGARRQVRRQLAEVSRAVLDLHRGMMHPPSGCPLCQIIQPPPSTSSPS
jgi:hypothetical protein